MSGSKRNSRCVRAISGTELRLADGTTSVLKPISDTMFETEVRGVFCRAELGLGDRALFWSDGDRWVRAAPDGDKVSAKATDKKPWSGNRGARTKFQRHDELPASATPAIGSRYTRYCSAKADLDGYYVEVDVNKADVFEDDGELSGPLSGLDANGGPVRGLKLELAAQALLGPSSSPRARGSPQGV